MSGEVDERSAGVVRIEALRRGDERVFTELVRELDPGLRRMVRHYVGNPAVAEEVIQETWLGVVRGIFAFEGRSSLKTWVFRILINRAKTRAAGEKRTVPFEEPGAFEPDDAEATPVPDRLFPSPPTPEDALLGEEASRRLAAAIGALPPNLRIVLTLRDVEGWAAEEVCNVLGIRETNQRVLLHRARSRVRTALLPYLRGARGTR
jgi:RNA polymerase sigma-70 factor (ECF subfamily)